MSWKKFFCGVVAASMIFSASTICSAADDSANAKLARIEIDTYGAEQSGAILDRISQLEKSYSGRNMTGNMNARIEAIYDTLYDNSAEPGILAKINVLEWNINHKVADGGIDSRLVALENQIIGKSAEGTFNERIRALAKAAYGSEILPIAQIQIPMNTLIKVATTAPASSKVLQEGDFIPIKVISDVFVDDSLVFASGLTGEGVVKNVRRAKHIFSNGKIETDFYKLKSLDGQDIEIFTGVEAVDAMNAASMSSGLSLVGQTFSGKNKELEEVLVRGKNVDLPAGIELYVQTKIPVVVYGLKNNVGYELTVEEQKPVVENKPEPIIEQVGAEDETLIITGEPTVPKENPPQQEPPKQEPPKQEPPKQETPPQENPSQESIGGLTEEEFRAMPPEGYDEEIIEIIDE